MQPCLMISNSHRDGDDLGADRALLAFAAVPAIEIVRNILSGVDRNYIAQAIAAQPA